MACIVPHHSSTVIQTLIPSILFVIIHLFLSICFCLIVDWHLSSLWNGLTLFCTVVALLEWLIHLHVIDFLRQIVLSLPKMYEMFPPSTYAGGKFTSHHQR